MRNYLAVFIIIFITSKCVTAQHLYVKSNILNWVFARPSLDLEFQITNMHSLGIHTSIGNTFWKEVENRPYYQFQTASLDYNYTLISTKKDNYQLRLLCYVGMIKRQIYQQELVDEDSWLILRIQDGRDFTGKAMRYGIGISNVVKPTKRFAIEQNIGFGFGKYYSQQDIYYPVQDYRAFVYPDFRFAIHACYRIF